jgi:hypothetical protein
MEAIEAVDNRHTRNKVRKEIGNLNNDDMKRKLTRKGSKRKTE